MLHLIMVISTLVMTAVRVFGEFIQKALQDSGLYSVTLVEDPMELINLVQAGGVQAAILDMELKPDPIELVTQLIGIDPELIIILFNDKDKESEKEFSASNLVISYEGVLRASDLMDALEALIIDHVEIDGNYSEQEDVKKISFPSRIMKDRLSSISPQAPDWLGDVNDVAQILTRLTLESAAHAALITKNIELWAYAGHLSRPAAEELAQSLWHYWSRGRGSDLAQFILLEATHREYILYATGLGGEYVLGLAFEAAIPFSEMRLQASILAKKLTNYPNEFSQVDGDSPLPIGESFKDTVNDIKGIISSPKRKKENILTEEVVSKIPDDWLHEELHDDAEIMDTDKVTKIDSVATAKNRDGFNDYLGYSESQSAERRKIETRDSEGESPSEDETGDRQESPILDDKDRDTNIDSEAQVLEGSEWENGSKLHFKPDEIGQTADKSPGWSGDGERIEQALPEFLKVNSIYMGIEELPYACVLLPRIPHHTLDGDLKLFLERWISLHAIAFGWRLEHLVIKPESFHWVGILSSHLAPGVMVKELRERSSNDIFNEFPRLAQENPSGDFWAIGSLIINDRQTLPDQLVKEYEKKTRIWQGITKKRQDEV